ncbi:anaerobic ribonucleoside-triphosphate reductase activating protein [Lachnospiraceae bacterium XBB2008]|nr:anaerobic ribonucleoside-triphosphate reductase activating protein [Lachnospiraceae bacterium XBB2008]
MNYCNIKPNDVADGEGVRVTLFVSGCTHHCKGCFQPETWNFNYGEPYTAEVEDYIISKLSAGHISGLTLLGGEPFEPDNQRALVNTLRRVKKEYPDKNIWAYSGYTMDTDLIPVDGKAHCEVTDEMLSYIDVLVDGEFKLELKSLMIPFRGSTNQRIIDVPQTLASGEVKEYDLRNKRKYDLV